MMKRVLVPLDGSPLAEAVLDPVVQLVKATQGSILLFHAVTPAEWFGMSAEEIVNRERKHSAGYLARLAERLGQQGIGIEERIVTGEPSRAIATTAGKEQVDLIAMSTHGRSGVREWALGSVAERVLRSTLIPVLAFRGKPVGRFTIRRILVPLDGSETALEVLDPACELADSMKAEVFLIHVGKHLPDTVERAMRSVERRRLVHKTLLRHGDPMKVILETLQEQDCDLIAMTPTGASQRDRIFFGSVAEEILKKVERPVLIVRSRAGK